MWSIELKADSDSALQDAMPTGEFPMKGAIENGTFRTVVFPEVGAIAKAGKVVEVVIPDAHVLARLITDGRDFVERWGGTLTVKQV